jgi:hypothetical protein
MTTRISRPPKESSVRLRSVYQLICPGFRIQLCTVYNTTYIKHNALNLYRIRWIRNQLASWIRIRICTSELRIRALLLPAII